MKRVSAVSKRVLYLATLLGVLTSGQAFGDYIDLHISPACTSQTLNSSGSSPLTYCASCSSGPGVSISESDLASWQDVGSKVTLSGAGIPQTYQYWVQDVKVAGLPPGTDVDLDFDISIVGTYSWDMGSTAVASLYIPFNFAANGYFQEEVYKVFYACGPESSPPPGSVCTSSSTTGGGPYVQNFFSGPIGVTVGTPFSASLSLDLQLGLSDIYGDRNLGSIMADFLDPTAIVNIKATDPVTGQALSGLTITGTYGTPFPVNVASNIPEPSTLALLAAAVVLLIVTRCAEACRLKWHR